MEDASVHLGTHLAKYRCHVGARDAKNAADGRPEGSPFAARPLVRSSWLIDIVVALAHERSLWVRLEARQDFLFSCSSKIVRQNLLIPTSFPCRDQCVKPQAMADRMRAWVSAPVG